VERAKWLDRYVGHGENSAVTGRTAGVGAAEWLASGLRSAGVPGHGGDPDSALRALQDVRLVRGLLGQAEVNAVRVALAGGRSLSEVAAALGITREQAERQWPDLAGIERAPDAMLNVRAEVRTQLPT
jgi:glucokinase